MATRAEGAHASRARHLSSADGPPDNEGDRLALFLIVQDGDLHSHTRPTGASYA